MPRSNRPQFVMVRDFFQRHHRKLGMRLISYRRRVFLKKSRNRQSTVRGSRWQGFFKYFAHRRAQVLGNSEFSYLIESDSRDGAAQASSPTCASARHPLPDHRARKNAGGRPPRNRGAERGSRSLQTKMISMKFINAATLKLEHDFAPTTTEHGCMIDVRGIGILIKGKSGAPARARWSSDCSIAARAWWPTTRCKPESPGRDRNSPRPPPNWDASTWRCAGSGIINVPKMFGAGAMRVEKRLDLIVELIKRGRVERVGARSALKRQVPHRARVGACPSCNSRSRPGRDMAHLVEVAALDQKLKSFGHDSALEFNKKLLKFMSDKTIS